MIDTEALGLRRVVAAYLINGKERALVDMGYRSSAETVIRDLLDHGVDGLDYLLPTHVHLDHAGACGALASKYPTAKILAHPRGVPHLTDPSRLVEATNELFGSDLMLDYGLPDPIDQSRVSNLMNDDEITLGRGITVRAIWTPGHASHHLSYFDEEARSVFTGDAVGILWPDLPFLIPTTPPTSFNLKLALESLARIGNLRPSQLLTPHFGVVTEVSKHIDENVRRLLEWKDVIESLTATDNSVTGITETMIRRICRLAGRSPESIPEHIHTTIRLNVLGLLRYLRKDIR